MTGYFTSDSALKLYLCHGTCHDFLLGMSDNSHMYTHYMHIICTYMYIYYMCIQYVHLASLWLYCHEHGYLGMGPTSCSQCFWFVPSRRVIGHIIISKYLRNHYTFHTRYAILAFYQSRILTGTDRTTHQQPPCHVRWYFIIIFIYIHLHIFLRYWSFAYFLQKKTFS